MMEGQHSHLRKLLCDSAGKTKVLSGIHNRLFSLLHGRVSHLAIEYMCKEYDRGVKLGDGLDDLCGCYFVTSRGLPCACRLHWLAYEDRKVHVEDCHVFWSTMVYGDGAVAVHDTQNDMETMFDEIRNLDPTMFREVQEVVHRQLHQELEDVEQPEVVENQRGRPKKSNARNKSHFEHAKRLFGKKKGTDTTTSGTTSAIRDYPSAPGAPLERNFVTTDLANFSLSYLLPAWFRQFYDSLYNPVGDGHCGFRALSHAVHGDESNWQGMRRALTEEIHRRQSYTGLYDAPNWPATVSRIFWPHSVGCSEAHWMMGIDLFAFATMFTWTICVVSCRVVRGGRLWDGSCTYLPICSPPGVTAPLGELWLLHDGSHWMRLRVKAGAPMPPFNYLWDMRDDHNAPIIDASVATWKGFYMDRVLTWMAHER